jgi:RND family efflux transporter MFP subunit
MNRYLVLIGLLGVFTACFSRQPASLPPVQAEPETAAADPVGGQNRNLQRSIEAEGFSSKGTIQAVTEVPVYSRIGEQIVEFNLVLGQRIRKGQVVVRLNQSVLQDKIARGQAELEKAEFQYQSILMGQGYKRGELEKAPEEIRHLARVNSGYNTAKAALQQLEHELTYCTVTAPVSGAVSRIDATLYGAATPGVPLFYIVDTEHLKVCFDVLENELRKFQKGARIQVISIAYPTEVHQAEVSAISPVVEKSGMVHLEAVLQPHPHLMPGMTAIVTLQ